MVTIGSLFHAQQVPGPYMLDSAYGLRCTIGAVYLGRLSRLSIYRLSLSAIVMFNLVYVPNLRRLRMDLFIA